MQTWPEAAWGRAIALALTLGAGVASPAQASGSRLVVAPDRVVLEGAQTDAVITLRNRGNAPSDYEVHVEDLVMLADGSLGGAADEGQEPHSVSPWLDFEPTSVHLGAGETQVVRIQASLPPQLGAGEYRAHLVITSDVEGTETLRFAVPVIHRVGNPTLSVSFGTPTLDMGSGEGSVGALEVPIRLSGEASSYGDVVVEAVRPGKPAKVIAERRRMTLVPTVPVVTMHLSIETRGLEDGDLLHVSFTSLEPTVKETDVSSWMAFRTGK
jgi:hypothetical protein